MIGKIATWGRRGFGFIQPVAGGAEIFAHCSALADQSRDNLPIGTDVQFDVRTDTRTGRPRAVDVKQLDANGVAFRPSLRDAAQSNFRNC
jgi:CspA family cold shock protein